MRLYHEFEKIVRSKNAKIGDKIKVIQRTAVDSYEHDGEITQITDAFIETKHWVNALQYPGWGNRAYDETFTKHYELNNIIFI